MVHQHRPWGYTNSSDGKVADWELHPESLARLSVGLEHPADLIKDLEKALQ